MISDTLSETAQHTLASFETIAVDYKPDLSASALGDVIGEYDGLIIRSATRVTRDLLRAGTRLRVVGRAGIGVDNIDIPTATHCGVVVMNTPSGNAVTAAEHTLAMMLAAARNIAAASASTRAGRWEKSSFVGVELEGKTLGLIGVGKIGGLVVKKALALGMRILAYDPYLSEARATELEVALVDLETLFASADFLSLHTPATAETLGIVDEAAFRRMRPSAILVNCARGGLVDESALAAALIAGEIAAAAVDVFTEEPLPSSHPLLGADVPHLTLTPHLGASTHEAQEKVAVEIANQVGNFLVHGTVTHALNMPALTQAEAKRLAPFVALARDLGLMASQLNRDTADPITSVELVLEGTASGLPQAPLLQTVVAELLRPSLAAVNLVNALQIAEDRGLGVASRTVSAAASGFQNRLFLRVGLAGRERSIAGSVIFSGHHRIVALNGIALELRLTPHMIYIRNRDIPGQIGRIGMVLGDRGVNIAGFQHARVATGEAIGVISVDEPVTADLLSLLRSLEGVVRVCPLHFPSLVS
ncbi:MAG: phosphoglycerate dehydrogenase [Alphaproteobacteria bacterium]|nr:phosphoglycerate dehydrogenase [Alphaproteobacteria bacterium]